MSKLRILWIVVSLLVAGSFGVAAPSEDALARELLQRAQQRFTRSGVYIVQMAADPAASHGGGARGLDATSPAVRAYTGELVRTHEVACDDAGVHPNQVLYHYTHSFNGFAAKLSPPQLAVLEGRDDVLAVRARQIYPLDTDNTPDFLGLTDPQSGLHEALGLTGEDVIIGMVDTGLWPEHPSFADSGDDEGSDEDPDDEDDDGALEGYGPPPARWNGTCQTGEAWTEADCNDKVIGARFFSSGFELTATLIPEEFVSARDSDGHGSHTAGTSAGNAGVHASITGHGYGSITGMAPRARLAIYKACWAGTLPGGFPYYGFCDEVDLVAAIDAAVADGVDVISYSIGSSPDPVAPVEIAFFNAALAGIFVSKSAGNSGPLPRTVAGISPWVTTVGASTHDRGLEGYLETKHAIFSGGSTDPDDEGGDDEGSDDEGSDEHHSLIAGQTQTGGTDFRRLVDGVDVGSEFCVPGELVPYLVRNRIVLCKWGAVERVDKSLAVELADGAGMVLYNDASPAPQDLAADVHYVPSLHVSNQDGLALKDYVDLEGPRAKVKLLGATKTEVAAPFMAPFSSRGETAGAEDLLKPDLTAPGVGVLAARSPAPGPQTTIAGAPGQRFGLLNGTSMSTPHVAGVAALLREAYPDWSPAMIKSALMTTAGQDVRKEDGLSPADPLDFGAGHLDPNPAIDPGLVYDAGAEAYCAYLCGAVPPILVPPPCICAATSTGLSSDASDLNLPSIAVASLLGRQTVVRTVTNMGPSATYEVSVDAPPGYEFDVTPESLNLSQGASAEYELEIVGSPGPSFEQWAFGSLTWSDGRRQVRSPVVARGDELLTPPRLFGQGTSGMTGYELTAAFDGGLISEAAGLVAPTESTMTIEDDPANDIFTALFTGVGLQIIPVALPPGTKHFRAAIFDEFTSGNDELNLLLAVPSGGPIPVPIDIDFSIGSTEQVNLAFENIPPEGLVVFVVVWALETEGPDTDYTLFQWLVHGDEGNLSITAPSALTGNVPETVMLEWTGLATGTSYLGGILHGLDSGRREFVPLDVLTLPTSGASAVETEEAVEGIVEGEASLAGVAMP